MTYGNAFYTQLVDFGFATESIVYVSVGYIRTQFGEPYFGFSHFEKDEEEVFVDCGCFNGDTSLDFAKWCKGKYKSIEAFEPVKDCCHLIEEKCNKLENFKLYPYGLWSENAKLNFSINTNVMGSRVEVDGMESIQAVSLDSILDGKKVSFIKMDIEGAELEALTGCEKIIKKYKPKLAISMYHRPEDIFMIPEYIKKIKPDYKLYLRHHSNADWDFVLYAY